MSCHRPSLPVIRFLITSSGRIPVPCLVLNLVWHLRHCRDSINRYGDGPSRTRLPGDFCAEHTHTVLGRRQYGCCTYNFPASKADCSPPASSNSRGPARPQCTQSGIAATPSRLCKYQNLSFETTGAMISIRELPLCIFVRTFRIWTYPWTKNRSNIMASTYIYREAYNIRGQRTSVLPLLGTYIKLHLLASVFVPAPQ